jgi:lipoate synthase
MYAKWGREIGIEHMYCGPFIRSSYNASLFVEAQA